MSKTDLPRDARLDQIGFVAELQKHHADDLKSAVKVRMAGESIDRATGDFFEGLLVEPGAAGAIDPARWLRLYETGELTKAEFLEAVSVSKTAAAKHLSGRDIDRICKPCPPASPRLNVTRIKGVEIELVDAVSALAAALRK